jgi:hypothetical protein
VALGPGDPTLRRVAAALARAGGDTERDGRLRRAVEALLDLEDEAGG